MAAWSGPPPLSPWSMSFSGVIDDAVKISRFLQRAAELIRRRCRPIIAVVKSWRRSPLDLGGKAMEISGTVQNGVVVLDGSVSLPEGASVVVIYRTAPVIRVAKNQKRVELPLFPSSAPGALDLTNERMAEILDEEEIDAMKGTWSEPS